MKALEVPFKKGKNMNNLTLRLRKLATLGTGSVPL